MILVTGGTGLVGSHLLASLVKTNDIVRAIHRPNSNIDAVRNVFSYYYTSVDAYFDKVEWVEADILDVDALNNAFNGITHVYHAAAIVSFRPEDYLKMRKINIEGTANIVNFSIEKNIQKLCFVSSVAAIGKAVNGELIDENCEWNSENNPNGYAITKFGAEMEVWRGTQEGLDAVIVNPGVILGGGFWKSGSGQVFEKIYKGFPFYSNGIAGYVDVKDVIKSMILLMNKPIKNERFILVSESISFKELFGDIAVELGKKQPYFKVTKLMSSIMWPVFKLLSFLTRKPPILTKNSAKTIHKISNYSSEKIKKEIDLSFMSIKESIGYNSALFLKDLDNN